MTPLANDVILGDGMVYTACAFWRGLVRPPSPTSLDSKFNSKGFLAWSEAPADYPDGVGSEVSPPLGEARTVADVLRVLGNAGATQAAVYESDTSRESLEAVAAGADVGQLGGKVSAAVSAGATAAGNAAGLVSALVRNWPIVAIGVGLVVAVRYGWIKV